MESRGVLLGGGLLLLLAILRLGLESLPHESGLGSTFESRLETLMGQSRDLQEENADRSRPLGPGERLDPNRATEADLDRLPGVGPATARAIESNRDRAGGFNRAEDLLRVPGIGPAKLERMEPHLDFSAGVPLDLSRKAQPSPVSGRSSYSRTLPEREAVPSKGDQRGGARSESQRTNVNRASAQELQELPGIGPALAERILESRKMEGPFRVPEDLLRVKGIGEAKLARLRTLVGFDS